MRARRDALTLRTPLFLLQAADSASPPLFKEHSKKLFTAFNPLNTGHMHGILPVHLGMRVRLLNAIDKKKGLVTGAAGTVVHIEVNPKDQDLVDAAFREDAPTKPVYLRHVVLGMYVRFDKYKGSPATRLLSNADEPWPESFTDNLVFLEPSSTEKPFKWSYSNSHYLVHRVGWNLTHGNVGTSQFFQGMTLNMGVVIDCARRTGERHPLSDDKYWLDMYVMLSRATKLENILLVRAPEAEFLLQGPPKSLQQKLKTFNKRVTACRGKATKLAQDLGLAQFLR